MKKEIVQVGNAPTSLGGITTVINSIMKSPILGDYNINLVPTSDERKKYLCFIKGAVKFFGLCIKGKISIAHIHMSENGSCYRKAIIIRISKLFKIPVILHSHGSNFQTFYDALGKWRRAWLRDSFCKADKVIVLTDSWGQYWSRIVESSKIIILPNCVAVPNHFNKKEYDGKLKVLFMGRLGERKGVYDLIAASKILSDNGMDFEVDLCGDGEIEKCKKTISELNIQDKVKVRGWINGLDKEELLKSSDILVLPSYYESFGIVLLEAMAYKIPVICGDGGAMKEIVSDSVDGFVIHSGNPVEIAEKIQLFGERPDLLQEMGKNGYDKIKLLYSDEVIMGKLREIYEGI
ncbi:MAG: glycosyltransferase family 4 protein [Bacteroidales bacterium]|nr:glycosyltransferase family 4 protein [Clostridium sp.]MCM1203288.1 glycosyltransferase family 4 protein [Bacteroidales bacterium]